MYLVHKCGEGKSLVLLGTATMLRGVFVCMVPLIGLGSDQVSKTKITLLELRHIISMSSETITTINCATG